MKEPIIGKADDRDEGDYEKTVLTHHNFPVFERAGTGRILGRTVSYVRRGMIFITSAV
jgi:hypothetical protein